MRRYRSPAATHCSFCCRRIAIVTASSRLTGRSGASDCSMPALVTLLLISLEVIRKISAGRAETHGVQPTSRDRPGKKLAADRRQHRIGENGVNNPPAALHLGASTDDEFDRIVV